MIQAMRPVSVFVIISLACSSSTWGATLYDGAGAGSGFSGKTGNVALGKKVTSLVPESRGYARPAAHLTDGNLKTDAYPGAFTLSYVVDLTTHAEGGNRTKTGCFDVDSIILHWGHYGRHFPGVKREDGSWQPAAYKADYVKHYRMFCRTTRSGEWKLIHTCSSMPTEEKGDNVLVTRDPPTASASEGHVTTTLRNLALRDVTSIRIEAGGGHWIGVHEMKVLGRPSAEAPGER